MQHLDVLRSAYLLAVIQTKGILPLQPPQHVEAHRTVQVQQELRLIQLWWAANELHGQLRFIKKIPAFVQHTSFEGPGTKQGLGKRRKGSMQANTPMGLLQLRSLQCMAVEEEQLRQQ